MIYGYITPHHMKHPLETTLVMKQYAVMQSMAYAQFFRAKQDGENRQKDFATLLATLQHGDQVVIYDAFSIARSIAKLMPLIQQALAQGVAVHFAKYGKALSPGARVRQDFLVSLFKQIEQDYVACRQQESMIKRRENGKSLGRPKGCKNKKLKLDAKREVIQTYLDLHVSRAEIAKVIGCHPQTLYHYIKVRGMKPRVQGLFSRRRHLMRARMRLTA